MTGSLEPLKMMQIEAEAHDLNKTTMAVTTTACEQVLETYEPPESILALQPFRTLLLARE